VRGYKGFFASFVFLVVSLLAGSAHAQLAAGCSCPAGTIVSGSQCASTGVPIVLSAPVCTGSSSAISQSVRSVAVSQQQLSFSNIQTMLEGRRDQLQNAHLTATPLGYANEEALGYAATGRSRNAFASIPFKAPASAIPAGPSWASWAEGLGDWRRDSAVTAADSNHFAQTYGAQGGVDATWQSLSSANDALVVGLVASWMTSRVTYDGSPVSLQLKGPGVGLYGTYLRGNFSTDLAVKTDFLTMDEDFSGLSPNASISATNFGVTGNAQYKIMTGTASFVEPTGGFSFTRTDFGGGAAALDLKDASTLRLQAGLRFGTSTKIGDTTAEPTLKVLAYDNVVAEGSSIAADTPGAAIVPTDQGKVRGEVDPAVNFDFGHGYSSNISGQVVFGEALVGGGLTAQLRKQW